MLAPAKPRIAATHDAPATSEDTLEFYRWAVQDPETHAVLLQIMYQRLRPGRHPQVLREDFAGTSAESVAWVALKQGRRAVAIDLDGPTLEWAARRAGRLLGPRAPEVRFVHSDVMRAAPPDVPEADITSALNFSILYHHTRAELDAYLTHARHGLAPDGILVLNLLGGADATRPGITTTRVTPKPRLPTESPVPPFNYQWEVRSYDPVTAMLDGRIHFSVPDLRRPEHPTTILDAFRYNFRLWSADDLIRACTRAGFSDVQLWRHTYDPSKGAAGVFIGRVDPTTLPRRGVWTAYIVACR